MPIHPPPSTPLLLQMKHISKWFGATCALDGVNFDLRKGEVHALIGENGAGKSTLVKILSGAVRPDSGSIHLEGRSFSPSNPLASRKSGISMIYQELNLAPHLTAEENIMLGQEMHKLGLVLKKRMRQEVYKALELIHHSEIPCQLPVRKLSVGAKQIVEISRALVGEAKILIMDEPTSSLTQEDTKRLFQIIRRLKNQGVSIIYISHFLEEIQQIADRFTMLRDGRKIHTGPIGEASVDDLIQMMVGRKFVEMFPRIDHVIGDVVLRLEGLKGKEMQEGVDLSLRRGEILGIAGLIGAGRTEVLRTVFGLDSIEKGFLVVGDVKTAKGAAWTRISQGMGLLSEDRQEEGLALSLSIADNLTLSQLSPYQKFGFLRLKRRKEIAEGLINRVNIKAQDTTQSVFSLSGGNQQKVALARLLHQKADILLLDEPTRGIDVLSKSQIYEWMGHLASEGRAIIFVSSYFPELIGVCDKIAVFHRGMLVDFRPVGEWNTQSIMVGATLGRSS
ncbi:MAG: sugar ABC transporter ATP-binding protein [Candidatus Aminicenantes bacterium]|nr:sugar ABC transporter ATP-binding protein [Candidatus Aminicenantes bacterium]MDH5744643.1 sugar ABC transporter ATP-binding protein [Candidatus Aminicenantes bacterium]